MDFVVYDEVSEMLQLLEDAKLGWIATEIRKSIEQGKGSILEEEGHVTEAYTPKEQMDMTLNSIRLYTIELHNLWTSLDDFYKSLALEPPLHIEVTDPQGKTLDFYYKGVEKPLHRLDEILKKVQQPATSTLSKGGI